MRLKGGCILFSKDAILETMIGDNWQSSKPCGRPPSDDRRGDDVVAQANLGPHSCLLAAMEP